MCKVKMKRNEDGSYTVTVDGRTMVFPDCGSAAEWADEQLEKSEE